MTGQDLLATGGALLGGLGLFLIGMRMLTDGLRVAAGPALRDLLDRFTRSRARGLLAGILITALVQSSSAVTVATVGFVNAGLLTLGQAMWIVFGANLGTTMTGWLVALVGVKLDITSFALPLLGLGMLGGLAAAGKGRLQGLLSAVAGFGAFFLGIAILQQGFAGIADHVPAKLPASGPLAIGLFLLLGFLLTAITQSSSAAMAIALTAASAGSIALLPAAAVVIGTNLGTTATAALAAVGATAPARRIAAAHILFNLLTAATALLLIGPLVAISRFLADAVAGTSAPATILALFHTLFNMIGVLLMVALAARLERFLARRFQPRARAAGTPRFLDPTLLEVPALAVEGLAREVTRMADITKGQVRRAVAGESGAAAETVFELGNAVRDFIARLSTARLPGDLVQRTADLLRATQHIENSADAARLLDPARRVNGDLRPSWEALTAAALEHLDQPAREKVEAPYGRLKADLLLAAASGRITPHQFDAALEEARQIRRAVESARKARRRIEMARRGASEPERQSDL
ncbi:MAG: Na/Pi symporter [Sphingomonadaceae bacterium]